MVKRTERECFKCTQSMLLHLHIWMFKQDYYFLFLHSVKVLLMTNWSKWQSNELGIHTLVHMCVFVVCSLFVLMQTLSTLSALLHRGHFLFCATSADDITVVSRRRCQKLYVTVALWSNVTDDFEVRRMKENPGSAINILLSKRTKGIACFNVHIRWTNH